MQIIRHIHRLCKALAAPVAMLMCAIAILPASAQVNADQVMRIGRNAMAFDDYVLAIQYFNQAIQAKPYLPQPYLYRAVAKYYLEDFTGAEADASKAIDINPFFVDAWEVRGASRMSLGKYSGAADDYAHLLDEDPSSRRWAFNRALAYSNLKDYQQSDSLLAGLIEIDPNFENAYLVRAGNALEVGDTIKAMSDIEQALSINPDNPNVQLMHYSLAVKYEKDYPKALKSLDELIRMNPRETELYVTRANLRYHENDYFGAMADYSYALQLDPDNEIATYNRALLRTEVLDIDNALQDYSKLIELDPDNDFARYQRAMIYANKGRYREAIADISKFINIYPTLATAYLVRSQWYLNIGDRSRAKADYDKGRALSSSNRPIKRQIRHKTKIELNFEHARLQAEAADEPQNEELTPEEFERRLNRVIDIDPESHVQAQYESSSIRGRIQYHNFDVDIEPMMMLTYYAPVSELRQRTYYLKEVDALNSSNMLPHTLTVASHPESPASEDIIQSHFASIEYYTSYIASHQPRAIDYIARALDFITLRNYDAAIEDIDRAIALSPDYSLAYLLRAQARYLSTDEDVPRATILRLVTADLDKAVELAADNAVAWFDRGNIAFETGDYTSALMAYNKAIELQPDMGEAFFNRGYANLKLGNPEAGILDLSKAGELGVVPAYNLLKKISK